MSALAIIGFFRSPLGHYLGLGLALLAAVGAIYVSGVNHQRQADKAREAAQLVEAQKRVAKVEAASAQASASLRAQLEDSQGRIQTRTRTLIQKVPLYVTAKDDADCRVPDGVVQLHDAAALGLPDVAGSAGQHEQAPRVALSDLTRTVVANYGIAYDWRAEALTWRDWYAAMDKARK